MASEEIVKFEGFALAKVDEAQLSAALDANLAGQQVEMGDLDRVKIPSGGGITWEVPTLEGVEPQAKLRVAIIHHKLARAMWKVSMDESGGGTPPDCSSPDNVLGYGEPGDALRAEGKGCAECPLSQFGSDTEGGRGQQCKQMHMLFVVGPDELLPMALALPPTSLKAAKSFLWRLSSKARPFYSVVVEIGLEKVKGNGVPDYARATFKVVEALSPEDTAKLKAMSDKLRPVFDRVRVVSGDDVNRGAMGGTEGDPAAPPPATAAAAEAAIPDDADQPLT